MTPNPTPNQGLRNAAGERHNEGMKHSMSRPTEGAAQVLMVLFVAALLISMLTVTMSLSVNSRISSADQRQILSTQYDAESEMALVRSRMRDIQSLLSNPSTSSGFLRLPAGSLQGELRAYALLFCGKSTLTGTLAWVATNDFSLPRTGTDSDLYPNAEQCVNNGASTLTSERFAVLADSVDASRYLLLPADERPAAGATRTQLMAWWTQYLTKSTDTYRYTIEPDRVVNLNGQRYRFYVRLSNVAVSRGDGKTRRVLTAQQTDRTQWWFEFEVPNPFENVVFDNKIPSSGAFVNNVFDGDYFTNEKVAVYSNSNVQFKGKFYSAGCTGYPAATAPAGTDCTKAPGFVVRPGTTATGPDASATGFTNINNNLKAKLDAYADFAPDKTVNFQAGYIRLPGNASQQAADAAAGGLVTLPTETGVNISVGNANGDPLPASSFNNTTQKWNEPSPVYQYIRTQVPVVSYDTTTWNSVSAAAYNATPAEYRSTARCGFFTCYYVRPTVTRFNTSREFRYGPDNVLYQKVGSTWTLARNGFNGVVYSAGNLTVSGPPRPNATSSSMSNIPPAVASFAKLNLTSNGDIKINSDLTMSDLPCPNSTFGTSECGKNTTSTMPTSILGLFTPTGDINIGTGAPNNVNVYAALMSSNGGLGVDNYDTGTNRGTMRIVGSVVEDAPGLKGTGSGTSGATGYTPVYSYDNRLKVGILPPSAPVTMVWKAIDGSQAGKSLSNFTWQQASAAAFR